MRQRLCFLLAFLLAPATANAHDHRADAFFGFCVADASSLPGAQFTWAHGLSKHRNVSILGDVNFNAGEHEDVDIKRFVYLVGARYAFGDENTRSHVVPSVHFLTGSVYDDVGPQAGAKPAFAFGGALDLLFKDRPDGWGLRFQAEYVANGGENYWKYSTGLVYRIYDPRP